MQPRVANDKAVSTRALMDATHSSRLDEISCGSDRMARLRIDSSEYSTIYSE